VDKTRDDREGHRAYGGHEPSKRAHPQIPTPAVTQVCASAFKPDRNAASALAVILRIWALQASAP
jgi:hypothetical protein